MVLDYRQDDLLHCLPHLPDVIKPNFMEFVQTFFPAEAALAGEAGEVDPGLEQKV